MVYCTNIITVPYCKIPYRYIPREESAPPNLRPWSSAGNGWNALSGLGMRSFPKWSSSSISGSCSRVRDEWSGRLTGGSVPAVMQALHLPVVLKKELSQKVKLSIHWSIYFPTLTNGQELWVVTEKTRLGKQAVEMGSLCRVSGLSLRDRVRSSVIREGLGVELLLLLHIERSQMRWLGHLVRMPPGHHPGEVLRACPMGRRPRGRPRTC